MHCWTKNRTKRTLMLRQRPLLTGWNYFLAFLPEEKKISSLGFFLENKNFRSDFGSADGTPAFGFLSFFLYFRVWLPMCSHYLQWPLSTKKNSEWLLIKKTAGEYHSLSLLDSDHILIILILFIIRTTYSKRYLWNTKWNTEIPW